MIKKINKGNMLRNQKGLTLVEVLAVIVLIALIMGVVAKGIIGKSDSAKAELNVLKMKKVQSYLAQYRLKYNKYPASLNGLVTNTEKSSDVIFTPLAESDELKDIWDYPLEYKTSNSGRSYSLKSLGADGIAGGDAEDQDIELTP